MLATCALYFEAQSPRKFVNVTHLRVLGESRIFLSVKANSGSDVNFCPNLESRNFAAVASVSGASIFDRICRGDTSLRPNRRTARRCTSGSNFEKVCRGTEVKPAVTHLSESTSRLSLCLCVTEALACLVLAGGALRGSLSLVSTLETLRGSPCSCSFWQSNPAISKDFRVSRCVPLQAASFREHLGSTIPRT